MDLCQLFSSCKSKQPLQGSKAWECVCGVCGFGYGMRCYHQTCPPWVQSAPCSAMSFHHCWNALSPSSPTLPGTNLPVLASVGSGSGATRLAHVLGPACHLYGSWELAPMLYATTDLDSAVIGLLHTQLWTLRTFSFPKHPFRLPPLANDSQFSSLPSPTNL